MDSAPLARRNRRAAGHQPVVPQPHFQRGRRKALTQYLSDLRIEQAKRLLADESKLVRDVGQEVGFLTVQNFMRVFKSKTGVPPSEYRSTLPRKS